MLHAATLAPIALASMEAPIGKALPPSHLADATIAGIAVPPRATSIGDASPPPATAILPNFDDLEILNHPGHVDFYFTNIRTSCFLMWG